jgi:KipI family sensor histidine kinase inhibitor
VSTAAARILPVGDRALTVELGRTLDPVLNARVRGLDAALAARPFPGLIECVPAFASLLVLYEPSRSTFGAARDAVERVLDQKPPPPEGARRHVLPVAYGGANGPDLAEVAAARGLSEAEVVARHGSVEYTALFLGFLPGFAYLGTLDISLDTPRRATPRTRVPAGSVAIAGRLTGVYPFASPGGWSLIGRTPVALFDPFAPEAALIRPGDSVRFAAAETTFEAAPPGKTRLPCAAPSIEVLDGGLLTTIQDAGRHGHRRLGVPTCGALDRGAAAAANRALGNAASCAVLECTAVGPTLRFLATTRFALAGADLGAVLERADLGSWAVPIGRAIVARAGNVLSMRERRHGLRAYVAIAGGFDVPPVLGSCATDLVATFGGLEGRALRAGDVLAASGARAEGAQTVDPASTTPNKPVLLRVVAGPQDDMFTPDALPQLESQIYEVGPLSDRTGCRLQGPPLAHRDKGEILTDGMVPGCIQVPPDGQPIVMLADGPTTGGYPKIATVVGADLDLLAQLGPGDDVRFRVITVDDAQGAT